MCCIIPSRGHARGGQARELYNPSCRSTQIVHYLLAGFSVMISLMVIFRQIKETFKKIYGNSKIKKGIGVVFIIIGLVALFTPFTPGSWLIFVGLGFFGVRILFWEKIIPWLKNKFLRKPPSQPIKPRRLKIDLE